MAKVMGIKAIPAVLRWDLFDAGLPFARKLLNDSGLGQEQIVGTVLVYSCMHYITMIWLSIALILFTHLMVGAMMKDLIAKIYCTTIVYKQMKELI